MLVDVLYDSLSERWMPERVVQVIVQQAVLSDEERKFLSRALPRHRFSSMAETFNKAVDLRKQLAKAEELFGVAAPPSTDVDRVRDYIDTLRGMLEAPGGVDFKADRIERGLRKVAKLAWTGHRAYNKRFRLLARMVARFGSWLAVADLRDLAQIAKSRLATRIEAGDFKTDERTACFVAYLTAKLNKRSMFTFGKQERPYDEIADALFQRLDEHANWFAVACVHPQPEVLARLSAEQQGRLLGAWYAIMLRAARVLKDRAEKDQPNLVTLIVARGNDSSSWNEAAGAFNRAREGWINTLHALGGEALLDRFVPGKALRLMAADVAWGHRAYGDGLEPDTAVWGALPKPWEVVLDGVPCDREAVERACSRFKIEGKGWLAPRSKSVAEFKPTPELVHGVVVSSPMLAATLKTLGYFGGPTKWASTGFAPISRSMDGLTPTVSDGEATTRPPAR